MAEPIFPAVPVVYRGLYAGHHFVDAQQLGESLASTAKIANSVCHFLFFEEITHDPRAYNIRFFAGPPKANGYAQELVALMNSGQLPLFLPVLTEVAKFSIELFIAAIVKSAVGRKSEAEMAVEAIHDMAMRHAEFASQVHRGDMQNKERLLDLVDKLTDENRASLRKMPEPVGRSAQTMQVGVDDQFQIDEPTAEALRERIPTEVGDMAKFRVKIDGVFKRGGACQVRIIDTDQTVAGKITDPALSEPENVYTSALHEGLILTVSAKPTLQDGQIRRLYISDGKIGP